MIQWPAASASDLLDSAAVIHFLILSGSPVLRRVHSADRFFSYDIVTVRPLFRLLSHICTYNTCFTTLAFSDHLWHLPFRLLTTTFLLLPQLSPQSALSCW